MRLPSARPVAVLSRLSLVLAMVLSGLVTAVALSAPATAAPPVPIVIDDFAGNTAGPRTVTGLPLPGESTTSPGTFSESGDVATMTMNGNGNRPGGVRLDYALTHLDLTSNGSNTQFFLQFPSINRSNWQPGELAAEISIELTGGGVTGTYSTGIGNVAPFNVVLNFDCTANPVCFTPKPDFTDVTHVRVTVSYPQNFDSTGSLTATLDSINTTPTGGDVPPPATAAINAPTDPTYGASGDTLSFPVQFSSNGQPVPVWSTTTGDPLAESDFEVSGTAGGATQYSVTGSGATYTVTVGPLTSSGTVTVSVPAGAGVDAWAQQTAGASATTTFVIPVPPALGTVTLPDAIVGQPYAAYTVPVTAGIPAPTVSVTSGALPSGLSLSSGGVLSGTPAAGTAGDYPLVITAENIAGTDTASVTLHVLEAAAVTSPDEASFVVGTPGTFTVVSQGRALDGSAPELTLTGDLPDGLTFVDNGDGTGTISGTPTSSASGDTTVTVTAANGVITPATPEGFATQTLALHVIEAPAFTGPDTGTATAGTEEVFTITATGTPTPALGVVSETSTGTAFTSSFTDDGDGTATYRLTGDNDGVVTLVVSADNGVGSPVTRTYTFTVVEVPVITSADTTDFVVGEAGSFTVTASGTPAAQLALTSGSLPGGLTFTDNGDGTATIAGTPSPSAAGERVVEVTATNPNGVDHQQLTFRVDARPVFTSPDTATFATGASSTFTATATGTPSPDMAVTSLVFTGVDASEFDAPVVGAGTVTLSGSPTTSGTVTLTLSASNRAGTATQTVTIAVVEPPAFTSADQAVAVVGQAGSFTVTTSGSPAPALAIGSGNLPAGLTLTDNGDGTATIAGTPAPGTAGDVELTLTATTAGVPVASQDFTLKVKQAPEFTTGSSATFRVGTFGTFTIGASGVPTPWFTLSGDLPPGLVFTDNADGTATIAGTPRAGSEGTYQVVVNVENDLTDPAMTITIAVAPAAAPAPGPVDPGSAPGAEPPTASAGPTLPRTGGALGALTLTALALLAAGALLLAARRGLPGRGRGGRHSG